MSRGKKGRNPIDAVREKVADVIAPSDAEYAPVDPADEQTALDRDNTESPRDLNETYPDSPVVVRQEKEQAAMEQKAEQEVTAPAETLFIGETTMPSGKVVPVILPRASQGPSDTPPSPSNK